MADQKSDPKPQPKKEPAPLGDAGASTDPVVQNLIAHRAIAVSNGDDAAVRAIDAPSAFICVSAAAARAACPFSVKISHCAISCCTGA